MHISSTCKTAYVVLLLNRVALNRYFQYRFDFMLVYQGVSPPPTRQLGNSGI